MKALSIKQPWASLIASGIKDIENRTWKTHFRGRIYIHASAKDMGSFFANLSPEQLIEVQSKTTMVKAGNKSYYPNRPTSAIIGEVDIVDCVINHPSIWAEKTFMYEADETEGEKPIGKPIYNWVLANPVLYDKPILNVKGKLSFWEPDICLQKCESCTQPFDIDTMTTDSEGCWFCQPCYDELSPIWEQEYKDMVERGEIEPDGE